MVNNAWLTDSHYRGCQVPLFGVFIPIIRGVFGAVGRAMSGFGLSPISYISNISKRWPLARPFYRD